MFLVHFCSSVQHWFSSYTVRKLNGKRMRGGEGEIAGFTFSVILERIPGSKGLWVGHFALEPAGTGEAPFPLIPSAEDTRGSRGCLLTRAWPPGRNRDIVTIHSLAAEKEPVYRVSLFCD